MQSLEVLNPASLARFSSTISVLLEQKLWARILVGMLAGLVFGLGLASYGGDVGNFMNWLVLPARFFLKLIQMVIVPLIIASVIRGLASTTDVQQMKTLGVKFSFFVIATSVLAAVLGVTLTTWIAPGAGLDLAGGIQASGGGVGFDRSAINPDMLLNLLPGNPLASIVEGQMLEVVILSLIMGVALISVEPNEARSVLSLLETLQSVCMTIISWAMKLAPYAVFGMIAQVSASTGVRALGRMGLYVGTAFLGFLLMILIYVLAVMLVKKRGPIAFLKSVSSPMLLAFSTSSSAATMPMTMKAAEESLGVEPSVARFLIPLGTTVNMAGSAIWHTTAVVFISQAYGVDLTLGQIAFVVATSIGSAVGSPGVPGVGVGVLSAVLSGIGVPLEGISLILGVDRLVDMGCTVVNVTGDLTAATLFGSAREA